MRCLVALLATPGSGQEPVSIADWMVPIHTQPDDPMGGAYGTWAAGPDYKVSFHVSFHDGFAFYPILGPDYPENLPLVWHTESITAGGVPILEEMANPEPYHRDWRYEYRYRGVTEAYDVRRDGVEQSFVLHSAPGYRGEVVVTGRITTALHAKATDFEHMQLTFADAQGRGLIEYGRAFALDAEGRHTPVTTRFDGERIQLALDGGWLAEAAYPVVIDPLTSSRTLSYWSGSSGQVEGMDIIRDDSSNKMLVVYCRQPAANDYDLYACRCDDNFSGSIPIFTDITSSWITRNPQAGYIAGAWGLGNPIAIKGRWLLAFQCEMFGGSRWLRAYLHDRSNTNLNSGDRLTLPTSQGIHQHLPSVGGAAYSGRSTGLIVYQEEYNGTVPWSNISTSVVKGVLVNANATAASFGTPFTIASNRYRDFEYPCVIKESGDDPSASWIVVYQHYYNLHSLGWGVNATRIEPNGTIANTVVLEPEAASTHNVRPKVDGRDGRYLLCHGVSDNQGTKTSAGDGHELRVRRFDWSDTSSTPILKPAQILVALSSPAAGLTTGRGRGISYDENTDSHWAVVWREWDLANSMIKAARVGFNGGVVERVMVFPSQGDTPSLCYNPDLYEFMIVWSSGETIPYRYPVYGARFQYHPSAGNTTYGTSCTGAIGARNRGPRNDPFAGSEFFEIVLSGALPSSLSMLGVSAGQAAIPLGGPCNVLIDSGLGFSPIHIGMSGPGGELSSAIPIPDGLPQYGDLYWQWSSSMWRTCRSSVPRA